MDEGSQCSTASPAFGIVSVLVLAILTGVWWCLSVTIPWWHAMSACHLCIFSVRWWGNYSSPSFSFSSCRPPPPPLPPFPRPLHHIYLKPWWWSPGSHTWRKALHYWATSWLQGLCFLLLSFKSPDTQFGHQVFIRHVFHNYFLPFCRLLDILLRLKLIFKK
jgi:hypothetical protein